EAVVLYLHRYLFPFPDYGIGAGTNAHLKSLDEHPRLRSSGDTGSTICRQPAMHTRMRLCMNTSSASSKASHQRQNTSQGCITSLPTISSGSSDSRLRSRKTSCEKVSS